MSCERNFPPSTSCHILERLALYHYVAVHIHYLMRLSVSTLLSDDSEMLSRKGLEAVYSARRMEVYRHTSLRLLEVGCGHTGVYVLSSES
jgi:hypothetical protein